LTTAQDTTPAAVALVTTDGYCVNGKRLRLTGGTYGTAGSTYQTEIADFSNITAYGVTGITGIAYFMVQARNGLTYYYGFVDANGNGVNSQALAYGTTTVLTWFLSKVVDRSGTNNYAINYLPQTGPSPAPPAIALSGTTVPASILWTPTSAGSSTYTYKMLFNYSANANAPQSSIFQYVAGTPVANAELLSSIEIFVGTTVVKDYFLGYQASPLTGREELITVKECADSAGSNCLLPTTISYQTGSPGVSTVSNTALSSSGAFVTAKYDFNGDGYPDLLYNPTGTGPWYVAFGSASGYGTPLNTGITGAALPGNLNGGTQDGILAPNGTTWYYYTWNGSSFAGTSTGLAFDSTLTDVQLADVNGDGLPDLVSESIVTPRHSASTLTMYTQLNTTTGSSVTFSSTRNTAFTITDIAGAQLQTPDRFQHGKLRRYDFNGDGADDLVLMVVFGTSPNFYVDTYELISTAGGTSFNAVGIAEATGANYSPVFFTDWNDDKCTDFVTNNTLYVSGCNGTVPVSYALSAPVVGAMDWDGDKRTDLIVANGSTIGVYLSQGTGAPTLTPTSVPYSSSCGYVTMDANGDGLDDLGCWSNTGLTYYLHNGTSDLATSFADGYGNSASPLYIPITEGAYAAWNDQVFPYQNYLGPLYVVYQTTFSDPSTTSGTYQQTFFYAGASVNLQGRGFAGFGAQQRFDSRNGIWETTNYGRVFPDTGMVSYDVRAQDNLNTKPIRIVNNGFNATTLSTTPNQQRVFPYIATSIRSDYEVGGTENTDLITTTTTNYTFDNYGNATKIVKTVTDNDPGSPSNPYNGYSWTTTTTNTTDIWVNPTTDLAAWCLTMFDETQVAYTSTFPGSTSVTRTKTFTPDTPSACRIKTVITEPTPTTNPYKVTEALTFDGFGNIQTDTVTGNNMPSSPASRLTTLNWGTTGQFLNSITDPSGAITTANYTSNQSLTFGVPDSVTNLNNLTTSWLYDAFGRKSKETRPDSTYTTWTYNDCATYGGCILGSNALAVSFFLYSTSGVIQSDGTTYFDTIDRPLMANKLMISGGYNRNEVRYDSLGRLAQQAMPCVYSAVATPCTYWTTNTYDILNRLTQSQRPISSTNGTLQTAGYGYAGRTRTVTDPYGNKKTTITDVNGWLRQTKDAVGYNITRTFDAAGSLIGVTDSVGNTLLSGVTYAYGLKPFRTAATDADRGAWVYTVDSLGERTGWTDAKGQSFSMTYDALSRPLTRTEPDLFTQWTWGSTPASHNVGQQVSECTQTVSPCSSTSALYYVSRTFDSDGRTSTIAITESGNPGNDPGGVFLFTLGYNSTTGFLNSLTYPISTSGVALNIQYGFQNGLLQSVTDSTDTTATCGSTCTLWTANAMNAFGEITQETLGNGVVTNRSYDAVTSWLMAATAGVGGGAALLNQSYLEDENGNIIQRQNNNAGLTESFAYDADQRMTCAALSSTCTTPTLAYDGGVAGPGNITSQTGVGTYAYPAAGQPRPHAVTSLTGTFNGITNPSFVYDANGNMTNRAGSTIAWSSYNYPVGISASDVTGTEDVQLSYGPNRQRWKQIYTGGPTGTETTYYIGGLMEEVFSGGTSNYRHYIYAGNEAVAVYSRTSASVNTMSYMLEDHQGGVSNIASNSGASVVNESFSAFGTRRNPTTWSGAPTTGDLNTIAGLSRQGYTMQTWLGQSMGLNHMNGRVEDAILGRFLSADPYVPDPTDAQSYNRYTYVRNNPLTFVDPTGFTDCASPGGLPTPGLCDSSGGSLGVSWFGGGGGFGGGGTSDNGNNTPPPADSSTPTDSGYWQANPGENLTVQSDDGTSTPYNYGLDQAQDPTTGAVVAGLVVEAHPYSWVDTSSWDFSACNGCNNLAAFARGATHYNINRVLLQFTALSMIPPAALVAGPPVAAAVESGVTIVTAGAKQLAQRQLMKMILNGVGDIAGAPSVEAQGMSPEVAEIVQQLTEQAEKLSQAMEIAEYWEL
jgi:RHS repeat-associated protein